MIVVQRSAKGSATDSILEGQKQCLSKGGRHSWGQWNMGWCWINLRFNSVSTLCAGEALPRRNAPVAASGSPTSGPPLPPRSLLRGRTVTESDCFSLHNSLCITAQNIKTTWLYSGSIPLDWLLFLLKFEFELFYRHRIALFASNSVETILRISVFSSVCIRRSYY